MSSVLDLVAPGAGSVATALVKILQLCSEMKEGQDACRRLHARLQEILTELQAMEERGQLPLSDALDNYVAVMGQYLRFMERYCDKTLASQLLKYQAIMKALLAINEDVDMLFRMLNLTSTAAMMDWKQQWEADRRAQGQAMVSMTHTHPAKRMKLSEDLKKLKVLADAEEAVEKLSAADTHCSACSSVIVGESVVCSRCGTRTNLAVEAGVEVASEVGVGVASKAYALPSLDCTTFIAVLMNTIATVGAAEMERALLLLVRKCAYSQERLQIYEANGVRGLSDVVKNGGSYVAQVYALELLSWATFQDTKMSTSEYEELRKCIRAATTPDLESMVDALLNGTDQEKEDDLVLCASLATRGDGDALREVGVVPPLVEFLRTGTVMQQQWVAFALGNLAHHEVNRVAIAREGTVSPLVVLVRTGTDGQKLFAAYALRWLAMGNEANRAAIVSDGGISPLVALVKDGTDEQKQWATNALGWLAANLDANPVAIACDKGISPLVALVRAGTDEQKRCAAFALGNIAAHNDANRVAIERDGAILPLVALVRDGTDGQKEQAAYALGRLAVYNEANCVAIARDGGISPLVALVRAGTNKQKEWAAFALGWLAANNEANCVAIARDGGISSLRALVRMGSREQKRLAVDALRDLEEFGGACEHLDQHANRSGRIRW